MIALRTDRVFGFFGSNPSPVPPRLMTAPAAGHPLPRGEGVNMLDFSPLPWGEGGESSEPGEGFLPTEPRTSEFGSNTTTDLRTPPAISAHISQRFVTRWGKRRLARAEM